MITSIKKLINYIALLKLAWIARKCLVIKRKRRKSVSITSAKMIVKVQISSQNRELPEELNLKMTPTQLRTRHPSESIETTRQANSLSRRVQISFSPKGARMSTKIRFWRSLLPLKNLTHRKRKSSKANLRSLAISLDKEVLPRKWGRASTTFQRTKKITEKSTLVTKPNKRK